MTIQDLGSLGPQLFFAAGRLGCHLGNLGAQTGELAVTRREFAFARVQLTTQLVGPAAVPLALGGAVAKLQARSCLVDLLAIGARLLLALLQLAIEDRQVELHQHLSLTHLLPNSDPQAPDLPTGAGIEHICVLHSHSVRGVVADQVR